MNGKEKILIVIGTIGAIVGGALVPSVSIVMGDVTDTFNPNEDPSAVLDTMKGVAVMILILSVAMWVFSYFYFAFWQHLAENITSDLRKRYMRALMKQEIAFFEKQDIS